MNFVCVLKTGGIYTAAHVERLRAMLWKPVICLTDDPDVTEPKIALENDWPGWWSKLELFKHDLGHVCYLDLDVTVNHLDWLQGLDPLEFYIMEDAYKSHGCPLNSSVMVWSGKRQDLIEGACPDAFNQYPSDQDWIWSCLKGRFTLLTPPNIISFKKHGLKQESGVVVYHGKPKPWDIGKQPPAKPKSQKCEVVELLPNSTLPKINQYKLAWDILNRVDPVMATPGCVAHAKCWLTYRTIEGEIQITDWNDKIQPIDPGYIEHDEKRARWQSSQETAEVYLSIIQKTGEWAGAAAMQYRRITEIPKELTPWNATNYMRVMALYCYALYLEGNQMAMDVAQRSIEAWQQMWQKADPSKCTLRYAELTLVASPLYVLSRLLITDTQPLVRWNWADAAAIKDSTPWSKCLAEMSAHPKGFWAVYATKL